jgi:hypothetical protein
MLPLRFPLSGLERFLTFYVIDSYSIVLYKFITFYVIFNLKTNPGPSFEIV